MDKFAIANVYPGMTLLLPGFEKYKISRLQFLQPDPASKLSQLFSCAGQQPTVQLPKNLLDKPGAIDTLLIIATKPVWGACPIGKDLEQTVTLSIVEMTLWRH
ncbi:hypothetical protein SAMN04487964_10968 [Marinobacterium sediminicola]|uniref:Uncharacterized protein n=1 Tax=Marinobacterium sediminicola TaxID=518898 RepID=A0ABY1S1I6_9GAMM|nr:hypothetical protein SAMN04487964_10968 [Marinobacterium sediminicola]